MQEGILNLMKGRVPEMQHLKRESTQNSAHLPEKKQHAKLSGVMWQLVER